MAKIKYRETLNMHIRIERKRQLEEIRAHHRNDSNPNASMTLIVEQLIAKEHAMLRLNR